jgi:hypothetical protein
MGCDPGYAGACGRMSALRRLSGIYVAAASFYGVAALLSSHPGLTGSADIAIREFAIRTADAASAAEIALAGPARALAFKGSAAFWYALEMERALANAWSPARRMSPVIVLLDLTPPSQAVSRSAALSGVREGSNKTSPDSAEAAALSETAPQFPN